MSNITVWGGRGGSSLRPHWMLAELGIAYETKEVDFKAAEHKSPAYLAINPAGQVPAMKVDEFVMAESMAMTHYLASKFKPEMNGATLEEQAKGMQWELWTLLNVQEQLHHLALPVWTGVHDEAAETKAKEALAKLLPVLDAQLAKSAYLAGESFTTGDLNACVSLTYASFSQFDLSSYANISRWMAACMTRPAYLASIPPAKA